jgi:predicted Zn finger-like uncharacterized protein
MRNNERQNRIETPPEATAPSHCPACRSRDVITTSKVVNDTTYWRCSECGEVWNAGRRRAAGRYGGYPYLGR